jgi:hypothetical protein
LFHLAARRIGLALTGEAFKSGLDGSALSGEYSQATDENKRLLVMHCFSLRKLKWKTVRPKGVTRSRSALFADRVSIESGLLLNEFYREGV